MTRRASRIITSTISEPTTAEATRQPNGVIPKTPSPSPISHLPTSGWTTMFGDAGPEPVGVPGEDLGVGLVDVVLRVAEVHQRPGVLGVVGLVELEGPRLAEVPEAQERRQQGDRDGADPGEHRVAVGGPQPRAGRRTRHHVARRGAREPDGARERGGEGHGD